MDQDLAINTQRAIGNKAWPAGCHTDALPVKANFPLNSSLISSNLAINTLAAKLTPPCTQSVPAQVHTGEPLSFKA
jgi:hypothetical protein